MRKISLVLGFCLLVLLGIYFVSKTSPSSAPITNQSNYQGDYASEAPEVRSTELSSQSVPRREEKGPLEDCLLATDLYLREQTIEAECTENYVHFFPTAEQKVKLNQNRPDSELRLGSFNLFHLGDNQAPMKSLSVMAHVIDQWDIVGAQEMMPLGGFIAKDNAALGKILQVKIEKSLKFPFANWNVIAPGYLRLLQELQKLDSSWALILQSYAEGEGGSGEMAGFFYRSSVVTLKEWDYCPAEQSRDIKTQAQLKNYGCLTQLSPDVKKLISRTAFAAFFKTGNFDFIGLSLHARFRPSMIEAEIAEQKRQLCEQFEQPSKCKISKNEIGRYYEVMAVAQQIPVMKEKAKDADVIFMGDFNLELKPASADIWKAALNPAPRLRPFQKDPSTVGVKFSKMISNYDHFILDTKYTAECIVGTAKAYDFVKEGQAAKNKAGREIAKYRNFKEQVQLAEDKRLFSESLIKLDFGSTIKVLSEKERTEVAGKFLEALERMKLNEHAVMLELISDHIPIEMTCVKNTPDDD